MCKPPNLQLSSDARLFYAQVGAGNPSAICARGPMLQIAPKHDINALPLPTRRGLSRVEAAEYIGIGASKFDVMVADCRMPKPKKIDGRRVWDVRSLDRAFEALPGGADSDHNP